MNAKIAVHGLVAYDGTDYHGFQYQVGVPTIQGALEAALGAIASLDGRVVGSGRTDAGVHAVGQVIAASVKWRHDVPALQRAWNAHLPPSIYIHWMAAAPSGFHPRFDAISRTYRYTLYQWDGGPDGDVARLAPPQRSPLTDRFALFVPGLLDMAAMQAGADQLLGEHDFATFGQPPQGENTIRQVTEAKWQMVDSTLPTLHSFPGKRMVFTISANAFLRRMVRCIVGALLEVGHGRWEAADVGRVLALAERRHAAPPAPACGLALERVQYPLEMGVGQAYAV